MTWLSVVGFFQIGRIPRLTSKATAVWRPVPVETRNGNPPCGRARSFAVLPFSFSILPFFLNPFYTSLYSVCTDRVLMVAFLSPRSLTWPAIPSPELGLYFPPIDSALFLCSILLHISSQYSVLIINSSIHCCLCHRCYLLSLSPPENGLQLLRPAVILPPHSPTHPHPHTLSQPRQLLPR